jgi:hypothetical protein
MGIIRAGIRQRAKGIIMLWASEKSTTAEVKEWKKTLEANLYDGSSNGWECKTGRLHNDRLGGALEHVTEYLVVARGRTIRHFEFERDTEDEARLSDIMDPPNSNYNDYFKYSAPEENTSTKQEPTDARAASIKHRLKLEVNGKESTHPVFDIDRAGPSLANVQYRVCEHPFLIDTNDGRLLPRTGRPIRRAEILRGYRFNDEETQVLGRPQTWEKVLTRLADTTPGHSLASILNALQAAEQLARDEETEEDIKETRHQHKYYLGVNAEGSKRRRIRKAMLAAVTTRSKRPIPNERPGETNDIEEGQKELNINSINQLTHTETDDNEEVRTHEDEEGTDKQMVRHRQALSRVINRWTTIPMPSENDWKEATNADPDTKYIYETIINGNRLNYGRLDNKRYYEECAEGKLEAENWVLYHWEEPKAKRLRQLRRKVVPLKLRQIVFVAYHATPLAGHMGIYKTY